MDSKVEDCPWCDRIDVTGYADKDPVYLSSNWCPYHSMGEDISQYGDQLCMRCHTPSAATGQAFCPRCLIERAEG